MEECDGGEESIKKNGYGPLDLTNLVRNKYNGGRRTSPQEKPQLFKKTAKEGKVLKCPQCDFLSQNEVYFNTHITEVHYK